MNFDMKKYELRTRKGISINLCNTRMPPNDERDVKKRFCLKLNAARNKLMGKLLEWILAAHDESFPMFTVKAPAAESLLHLCTFAFETICIGLEGEISWFISNKGRREGDGWKVGESESFLLNCKEIECLNSKTGLRVEEGIAIC